MPGNHTEIEKRLWGAADELHANSKLKSSEYSVPVLGLIFLRYADFKFSQAEQELEDKSTGRRAIGKTDYHARGVLYLPDEARSELPKVGISRVMSQVESLLDRSVAAQAYVIHETAAPYDLSRVDLAQLQQVAIKEALDKLSPVYAKELYHPKCLAIYQHVYDSYLGEGQSIYPVAT